MSNALCRNHDINESNPGGLWLSLIALAQQKIDNDKYNYSAYTATTKFPGTIPCKESPEHVIHSCFILMLKECVFQYQI